MKKLLAFLLALAIALSLTACGSKSGAGHSGEDASISTGSGENPDVSQEPIYEKPEQGELDWDTNVYAAAEAVYPEALSIEDWDAQWERWQENPVEDSFLEAVNRFALSTSPSLLPEAGENFCYSPLSLYFALAVTAAGTDGQTADQLYGLLGADRKTLGTQCGNLFRSLYSDNEVSSLLIANSVWMNGQNNFKQEFLANAVENYYASVFEADFASEVTGKAIADWISNATNGKLSYEPQVSASTLMAIINTIYFNDQWSSQFEETDTSPDTFTQGDGTKTTCDFMHQTAFGAYWKGENYACAQLELQSSGSMYFLLPDEGVEVQELLTEEALSEVLTAAAQEEGFQYPEIQWSVPRFSFDCQLEPIDTLKSLGVTDLFSAEDADLSELTDIDAYVSSIVQGTHIGLNEEGIEAAAYTVVSIAETSLEWPAETVEMNLNRPFLFAITAQNGAVLFVGICESVN